MSKEGQQPDQSPDETRVIDIVEAPEDERETPRRLVGNQLQPDQVEALVDQLYKESGRIRAQEPIAQGGPEAVLARLVRDARRRKRGPIVLLSVFVAEFAALIGLYLICAVRGIHMSVIDAMVCAFLCVCLVLVAAVARTMFRPSRVRKRSVKSAHTAAKYDDIRIVGHLAEALIVKDNDVATQAEIELTALLPRMRECDAALLNSDQRQYIYRSMLVRNVSGKPKFLIESLGLVERLGDTRALPEVLALASYEVNTASGREVKRAAESCLQVLRQTDSERDARRSLLRAASADTASGDELLRPTEQVNAVSPDELLRALPHD